MAANVNRPVVGQVKCYTQDCTETATVHQVAKGSRTGEYYLRCPVCKCNQSRGPHLQNYIRANMQARPGHEIPAAENAADEKQNEAIGQGPEQDGAIGQNSEPATEVNPKLGGLITGFLAVAAMVALIAGVKAK